MSSFSERTKVGIQGIAGCYHEEAAYAYFGEEIDVVEALTFHSLSEKLASKEIDYAVMAIENSIAGSILPNYSLVQQYNFHVAGEQYLHIAHALLTVSMNSQIDLVESHPMALYQTTEYLHRNFPNATFQESIDTALSAKQLSQSQKENMAVVAGKNAAKKYGLCVRDSHINDNQMNYTRFLILRNSQGAILHEADHDKASLSFVTNHSQGALVKVLEVFDKYNLNLTKLQSVPILGKPYQYRFFATLIWSRYEDYLQSIEAINELTLELTILGEYKQSPTLW